MLVLCDVNGIDPVFGWFVEDKRSRAALRAARLFRKDYPVPAMGPGSTFGREEESKHTMEIVITRQDDRDLTRRLRIGHVVRKTEEMQLQSYF